MNRNLLVSGLLVLLLLAAGCAANQELLTQVTEQGDRLSSVEGQITEMTTSVSGLTTSLEQLVEAEESNVPRFDVAMAQFVMDTAGFHGISESLAAGNPIEPSYLSAVTRVNKILSSTEFPEELHELVEHFLATLEEFEVALEADDLAAAAPLAGTLHDRQHELSEMIDGWLLGTPAGGHGEEG